MRNASETITIWNRWLDPKTKREVFLRSIIPNCFWEVQNVRGVNVSVAGGTSETVAYIANVYFVQITENINYLSEDVWDLLEDKSQHFTIKLGDYVAKGEVHVPTNTPISDIKKRYSGFEIKSFADNTDEYKQGGHYEIQGT